MSELSSLPDDILDNILDELAEVENLPVESVRETKGDNANKSNVEVSNDLSALVHVIDEEPIRRKANHKKKYLKVGTILRRFKNVRTDIRDNYSLFVVNAGNTLNLNTILQTFTTLCTPNVSCHIGRVIPGVGPNNFTSTMVTGPMWLSHVIYSGLSLCPDGVATIQQSKFYANSEYGVVTISIRYDMTKIHNITSIHDVAPKMMAEKTSEGETINDDNLSLESISGSVETLMNSLPLRKEPIKASMEIRIVMHTDPLSKYVTKVNMIHIPLTNHFVLEK